VKTEDKGARQGLGVEAGGKARAELPTASRHGFVSGRYIPKAESGEEEDNRPTSGLRPPVGNICKKLA
jgi:hypothetical protein